MSRNEVVDKSITEAFAAKRRQAERIGAGVNCITNAFHKHEKAPFELLVASFEKGMDIAKIMRARGVAADGPVPVERGDETFHVLGASPGDCTPLAFEIAAQFARSAPDADAVEESAALPDAIKDAVRVLREYSQTPEAFTVKSSCDVEAMRCALLAACDVFHLRDMGARRDEYLQVESLGVPLEA